MISTGCKPPEVFDRLTPPATAAAARELVNVDKVDTYVLPCRERSNDGPQRSRSAAGAADDLADIVGVDTDLQHPAATQFFVLDGHVVGIGDDTPDQMFERVGEHLGLARLRVGDTGIGRLLGLPWSALDLSLFDLGVRWL
jgi:hypothetical protein